jgi:hypothetical protein
VLLRVSRLFNHTVRTVLAKPALLSTTMLLLWLNLLWLYFLRRVSGFFNHLYVQLRPAHNPTAAADPTANLTTPLVGVAATAAAEALAPGAPLLVVLEALPRALLLCPAACVCRAWRAAVAIII